MIFDRLAMLIIEAFQQLYFRRSRRKGAAAAAAAAAHRSGNAADKENLAAIAGLTALGAGGGSKNNNNRRSAGSSNGSTNSGASNGSVKKSHSAEFTSVCDTILEPDFDRLVTIPGAGVDQREWMASHLLAFFHHVNALYGSVSELCTVDTCPVMNGPGNVQIPWVDEKGKKWKYSAPQYVDCVMSVVEKFVRSEDSFPTKFGHNFPTNFDSAIKKLCRLLYFVLGHLHVMHWRELCALGIGSQAQAVGRHFASFSRHYNLLDSKEMLALTELLNQWRISSPDTSTNSEPSSDVSHLESTTSPTTNAADDCDNQQQTKLASLQVSNVIGGGEDEADS